MCHLTFNYDTPTDHESRPWIHSTSDTRDIPSYVTSDRFKSPLDDSDWNAAFEGKEFSTPRPLRPNRRESRRFVSMIVSSIRDDSVGYGTLVSA